MFRRQLALDAGGFRTDIYQLVDVDFWLRLMLRSAVCFVPHELSVRRHTAATETTRVMATRRNVLDRQRILTWLIVDPLSPNSVRSAAALWWIPAWLAMIVEVAVLGPQRRTHLKLWRRPHSASSPTPGVNCRWLTSSRTLPGRRRSHRQFQPIWPGGKMTFLQGKASLKRPRIQDLGSVALWLPRMRRSALRQRPRSSEKASLDLYSCGDPNVAQLGDECRVGRVGRSDRHRGYLLANRVAASSRPHGHCRRCAGRCAVRGRVSARWLTRQRRIRPR